MKRIAWLGLVLVLALLLPAVVAAGGSTIIETQTSVDINETVYPTCASEAIEVTGVAYITSRTVVDAGGGVHITLTVDERDVRAMGQTSGTEYRRVGATTSTFSARGFGSVTTINTVVNYIGPRGSQSLFLRDLYHVAVDPSGEVRTEVIVTSVECR